MDHGRCVKTGHVSRKMCLWLALVSLVWAGCAPPGPYRVGGTAPVVHSHVAYRLLLIGDAGYSDSDSKVLAALKERAEANPEITTVAFLGDNIYPAGMPSERAASRPLAEARLLAQIDAVLGTGAETIFLPGNHDWDNSGPDGWQAIQRQQDFIEKESDGLFRLLPKGGDPGPVCEDKPGARLIMLDTQWWLHRHARPVSSEARVLERLDSCLSTAGDRVVVVLAHHPLQTYGLHGGEATLQDHLFPLSRLRPWLWAPLPGLGSAYVWARRSGASNQDMSGSRNQHMVLQLQGVLSKHEPLLYAAGHDHNLQVLRGNRGSQFTVVSGSGSLTTDVGSGEETLFAHEALGFIEIEFTHARRVLLTVHSVQGKQSSIGPLWRFVLE